MSRKKTKNKLQNVAVAALTLLAPLTSSAGAWATDGYEIIPRDENGISGIYVSNLQPDGMEVEISTSDEVLKNREIKNLGIGWVTEVFSEESLTNDPTVFGRANASWNYTNFYTDQGIEQYYVKTKNNRKIYRLPLNTFFSDDSYRQFFIDVTLSDGSKWVNDYDWGDCFNSGWTYGFTCVADGFYNMDRKNVTYYLKEIRKVQAEEEAEDEEKRAREETERAAEEARRRAEEEAARAAEEAKKKIESLEKEIDNSREQNEELSQLLEEAKRAVKESEEKLAEAKQAMASAEKEADGAKKEVAEAEKRANDARKLADEAKKIAEKAQEEANNAKEAAKKAQEDADREKEAAEKAQEEVKRLKENAEKTSSGNNAEQIISKNDKLGVKEEGNIDNEQSRATTKGEENKNDQSGDLSGERSGGESKVNGNSNSGGSNVDDSSNTGASGNPIAYWGNNPGGSNNFSSTSGSDRSNSASNNNLDNSEAVQKEVATSANEGPGETTLDVPILGATKEEDSDDSCMKEAGFMFVSMFLLGLLSGTILTWFLLSRRNKRDNKNLNY